MLELRRVQKTFVPGTVNEEYMQWLAGRAADAAEELLARLG